MLLFLLLALMPLWATLACVGYAAVRFSLSTQTAVSIVIVSMFVSVYLIIRLDGQRIWIDAFNRAIPSQPKYLVTHNARLLRVLRTILAANFVACTATTMAFQNAYVLGGHLVLGGC